MNRAKPLNWYTPTDHPQDSEGIAVAHGIGGRYSITESGDAFLLWFAEDEFVWERFDTVEAAKERAERDWQERFSAAQGSEGGAS